MVNCYSGRLAIYTVGPPDKSGPTSPRNGNIIIPWGWGLSTVKEPFR